MHKGRFPNQHVTNLVILWGTTSSQNITLKPLAYSSDMPVSYWENEHSFQKECLQARTIKWQEVKSQQKLNELEILHRSPETGWPSGSHQSCTLTSYGELLKNYWCLNPTPDEVNRLWGRAHISIFVLTFPEQFYCTIENLWFSHLHLQKQFVGWGWF